jgi:hypothetical protein
MENYTLVLNNIEEGDKEIIFNPALVIEVQLLSEDMANLKFDFGMTYEQFDFNHFITSMANDSKEKIDRMIQFELFHTFHHTRQDPNYTLLNWALFGNLAHRVICSEDGEIWIYRTDRRYNINEN